MATPAMDSVTATVIDGTTAVQWQRKAQRQRGGNGRLVVFADIEIEEEEIARGYEGAP